ncbi:hypothetical protein YN1_8090 [Nanoarchaeota archaeon]
MNDLDNIIKEGAKKYIEKSLVIANYIIKSIKEKLHTEDYENIVNNPYENERDGNEIAYELEGNKIYIYLPKDYFPSILKETKGIINKKYTKKLIKNSEINKRDEDALPFIILDAYLHYALKDTFPVANYRIIIGDYIFNDVFLRQLITSIFYLYNYLDEEEDIQYHRFGLVYRTYLYLSKFEDLYKENETDINEYKIYIENIKKSKNNLDKDEIKKKLESFSNNKVIDKMVEYISNVYGILAGIYLYKDMGEESIDIIKYYKLKPTVEKRKDYIKGDIVIFSIKNENIENAIIKALEEKNLVLAVQSNYNIYDLARDVFSKRLIDCI